MSLAPSQLKRPCVHLLLPTLCRALEQKTHNHHQGRPPQEGATTRGLRPPTSARSMGVGSLAGGCRLNTSRNTCKPFLFTCECSRVHIVGCRHIPPSPEFPQEEDGMDEWEIRELQCCKVLLGTRHHSPSHEGGLCNNGHQLQGMGVTKRQKLTLQPRKHCSRSLEYCLER